MPLFTSKVILREHTPLVVYSYVILFYTVVFVDGLCFFVDTQNYKIHAI
jgi:hypothetical protein